MNPRIRAISAVFAAALAVGACEKGGGGLSLSWGSVFGAGAGAAIGSQVGGGAGQLAAVAIGTIAGAWIGGEVEKRLDYSERREAEKAAQTALELNDVGAAYRWKNEKTSSSGTFKPTREFKDAEGKRCREFTQDVMIDEKKETLVGVACRMEEGTWRIVEAR